MKFNDRISPPLISLSHKLIDAEWFSYVESISNFMVAIKSGRWEQLPVDEQLLWLERLSELLGARALMDSWDLNDKDVQECHFILDAQIKALKKKI